MNNNSFGQIQELLAHVSNYVAKINEIIFQINNIIINSQNQMNEKIKINMMNFQNKINLDLNPLLNNQPQKLNYKMINIVFEYRGNFVNITAQEYLPITEVINKFFKKIDKPELINNYMNKMTFYYNSFKLDYSKKVGELNQRNDFKIIVVESKDLC